MYISWKQLDMFSFKNKRQNMLWLVRNPRLLLVQENNPMKEYFRIILILEQFLTASVSEMFC